MHIEVCRFNLHKPFSFAMLPRQLASPLTALTGQYPVVTVLGPRQSGKAVLCRHAFPDKPYANLDVGLACYLLGITAAVQITRRPLRGALVENLVVVEALKAHYHRGLTPRLYFYRDSHGNEVDLLLERGDGLHALEIKAGATVAADYFKGLRHLAGLFELRAGAVVYGGDTPQPRSDYPVVPALECDSLFARWLAPKP